MGITLKISLLRHARDVFNSSLRKTTSSFPLRYNKFMVKIAGGVVWNPKCGVVVEWFGTQSAVLWWSIKTIILGHCRKGMSKETKTSKLPHFVRFGKKQEFRQKTSNWYEGSRRTNAIVFSANPEIRPKCLKLHCTL